jgi:hypothetical protein
VIEKMPHNQDTWRKYVWQWLNAAMASYKLEGIEEFTEAIKDQNRFLLLNQIGIKISP